MTRILPEDFAFPYNMALFLDFDGTLVGFKDDPDNVHLSSRAKQILNDLHSSLSGALALISGRDLRDLSKRVPRNLWRLGNHGLFTAAPHEDPPAKLPEFPADLQRRIWSSLANIPGTRLEVKGPVIAVHHRANPKAGQDIKSTIEPLLSTYADHYLQSGHCVVEVKPRFANKGAAITRQMQTPPFSARTPVMIGDDTTDEDGFLACQSLGGFGIKIGEGQTKADYRLSTVPELYTHLERLT